MAASSESVILATSDNEEVVVDKQSLSFASRVFQELFASCEAGRLPVDETKDQILALLEIVKGVAPPGTFDTKSSECWSSYKSVLEIADKYDMPMVKTMCEKWLVSRCLRGRVKCEDFRFQDIGVGLEWLLLCQKYHLRDLGWYCAYDLGSQLGDGLWTQPVSSFLKDVHDPDFLKTMLEAVADAVENDDGEEDVAEGSVH